MRLAFAGTPEFAARALRALLDARHEVALVLTQPDRPAGRGLKLRPSPVKALALAHRLPLAQPRGLRLDGKYPEDAQAARAALTAVAPECVVVAAYGLILPAWTLAVAPRGCVNLHASLLPRWRGAAPIQRAIEAGDTETGITLMQMDAGLDTGDILLQRALEIAPDDSAASLHDRLAALGAALIVDALAQPRWQARPQPAEGVTYAAKIDKSEAPIDWRQPAPVIERRVRAFDPFPGASFTLDGETIKLWRADVVPDSGGTAGEVVRADGDRWIVACGDGALALRLLQRPGGRRIDAAAFLCTAPPLVGRRLGGA
jgi:methionyl-tRNA formyltransferase